MKIRHIMLLFVACLGLGCTGHHLVRLNNANEYAKLNRYAQGRTGIVILMDGRMFEARDLHMAPDSTTWYVPMTGKRIRVATRSIAEVRYRSRSTGAAQGFASGAATGAAGGFLMGLTLSAPFGDPSAEVGSVFAAIGAIPGAVIGGVAGGLKGSHQSYVVEVPEDNKEVASAHKRR